MNQAFSPKCRGAGAILTICVATALGLPAQVLTTLANFASANGADPGYGALLLGADGNFYGTTTRGGTKLEGAVFKMSPSGVLTGLYSFCSKTDCADGANPNAALIQAADGNFYGTTHNGGSNGDGTIFSITPAGALTTLYSFCSVTGCADGANPSSSLVQTADGSFYGTTQAGGASGGGTIFRVAPGGTFTTIYSFCAQTDCVDGKAPAAGLLQASDGNLYGTTVEGGTKGDGAVFRIALSGTLTTLYSFCSQSDCDDGANPVAGLIEATDGNFYGTTSGGAILSLGTIFKITSGGELTTLHSFCSVVVNAVCRDGGHSYAALMQAADGNLYGTTSSEGATLSGTIFRITLAGSLTTLANFGVAPNQGAQALAGLMQTVDGALYGTTSLGGTYDLGTIFKLTLDASTSPAPTIAAGGVLNAASFAKNAQGLGTAVAPGSSVAIFGIFPGATAASAATIPYPTSLGGVSVTFNGTPAPIQGVAPGGAYPFITAQVPFEVQGSATAQVVVTVNGQASPAITTPIVPAAPGIFTDPATGQGNAILVYTAANGRATVAAPANAGLGFATAPIPRGTPAFFYATGLGVLNPPISDGAGGIDGTTHEAVLKPVVTIGGITAEVDYYGPSGYPGVYQINIVVPQGAPTGDGIALVVTTPDGSVISNTATVSVI